MSVGIISLSSGVEYFYEKLLHVSKENLIFFRFISDLVFLPGCLNNFLFLSLEQFMYHNIAHFKCTCNNF